MKSLIFTIFMGAILFTACGESADMPDADAKTAVKAEPAAKPPPPPPPTKKAAAPPAAEEQAGGDCPSAMAEYEKFVDKYVSYMKKAAQGDASAMTGLASLMGQAEKAGTELAAAQGDLSVDCLKQYNDINKKMTDAAMEMSKATPTQKVEVEAAQEAAEKALDAAGCMQKCQGMTDPMKAATCMQGCM